jgi:uncharacterized protein (DUF2141 family)
VSIFLSEQSYKKQIADMNFTIDSANETIQHEITLAAGEYLISTHQDVNGNGDMDYGLFKIPKEPYGFSKMKGKIPGNFNAMKIIMNDENEEIIIPFVEY